MVKTNLYTEPLESGRGKRPKLKHETVAMRISPETRRELESLAQSYGCIYGGKPWIAGLLTKIANHELLVVPPVYLKPLIDSHSSQSSPEKEPDLYEKLVQSEVDYEFHAIFESS